jgi:cytochrome P450
MSCWSSLGTGLGRAVTTSLDHLEHRPSHLRAPPPGVPTPRNLTARKAPREFDELIAGLRAARRRDPGRDAGDRLAMLLSARDEQTGEGLTDREWRDRILTFIVAAHATTAVALSRTVDLLRRRQAARTSASARSSP